MLAASSLPFPRLLTNPISHRRRTSPRFSAAMTAAAGPSLYDVLGLPAGATCREIKAAYRRLARACHPDVRKGSSADEFMRIHAAYSTLSDADKRADYDRGLVMVGRSQWTNRPPPPFSGHGRRTWETDQCW